MGPRGLKNTMCCVQCNKSKPFCSCSDLLFFLPKEKASLNLSLNFKNLNSTSKFQDSSDSIYLIFFLKDSIILWLLFVQLINSFANSSVERYLP